MRDAVRLLMDGGSAGEEAAWTKLWGNWGPRSEDTKSVGCGYSSRDEDWLNRVVIRFAKDSCSGTCHSGTLSRDCSLHNFVM